MKTIWIPKDLASFVFLSSVENIIPLFALLHFVNQFLSVTFSYSVFLKVQFKFPIHFFPFSSLTGQAPVIYLWSSEGESGP
jgi:hypothetical protein